MAESNTQPASVPPTAAQQQQQASPPPAAPEPPASIVALRDKDGRLTRMGMEHAIRSGGSAMHNGVVHTTVDTLPSAAEMAKGNPDAEKHARDALLAQKAAIEAQLSLLPAASKK